MYIQPHLTQLLLQRCLASNESVFRSLTTNHIHAAPLQPCHSLYDLVQQGANDHLVAWPVFQALFKELTVKGASARPSVLVTADGIDHWMCETSYRNSEHKPIHAHQLSLVRQFVNLLFSAPGGNSSPMMAGNLVSQTPFVSGGMVLLATTGSNTPAPPTFKLLVDQMRALRQGIARSEQDFPVPKPYSKPDERVLALCALATAEKNVQLMELKGLSREESRGYLEYFAKSGIMHKRLTDGFVSEMRGLSGGGVVGELARLGKQLTT
jgi:small subunit ribosomal protein S29